MPKKDNPYGLTDKQEMFCQEYMIDLNATQACIRAGYSENVAAVQGSENLIKPNIGKRIAELKAALAEIRGITIQDMLEVLESWLYSDITETLCLTLEQVKELPIEVRRLVTSYKTNTKEYRDVDGKAVKEITVELKFVSKEKAAEMLNRHLGFYEIDNSQKIPTTLSYRIIPPDGT